MPPIRVLSAILFSPRGGSASAARALVRGLRDEGCAVRLVAGSRSDLGRHGDARTFYRDVRAVSFDEALASDVPMRYEGGPGSAPLHPSYEDRPGAPDVVFAMLDDLEYENQVRAWSRELALAGAREGRRAAPAPPDADQRGRPARRSRGPDRRSDPRHRAADAGAHRLRRSRPVAPRRAVGGADAPVGTRLRAPRRHTVGGAARPWSCSACPRIASSPFPMASTSTCSPRGRSTEPPSGGVCSSSGRRAGWPARRPGSARYDDDAVTRLTDGVALVYVGRFTAVKRLDHLIAAFGRAQHGFHSACRPRPGGRTPR